jgi:hypothetical protein
MEINKQAIGPPGSVGSQHISRGSKRQHLDYSQGCVEECCSSLGTGKRGRKDEVKRKERRGVEGPRDDRMGESRKAQLSKVIARVDFQAS